MEGDGIVTRRESEALVITIPIRRVTGTEDAVWQALDDALGPSPAGTVILDCGHVRHFFSAALGRLAAVAGRCRRAGARVVVRNLCPSQLEVFRAMRLDAVVEIESAADTSGD